MYGTAMAATSTVATASLHVKRISLPPLLSGVARWQVASVARRRPPTRTHIHTRALGDAPSGGRAVSLARLRQRHRPISRSPPPPLTPSFMRLTTRCTVGGRGGTEGAQHAGA